MAIPQYKWTVETILDAAGKCENAGEFRRRFPGAYTKASRLGMIKECEKKYYGHGAKWTLKRCLESTRPYKSVSEWRKGDLNAFMGAYRNNHLDAVKTSFKKRRKDK